MGTHRQEVHIGCSGWYYWHWRQVFYPERLPTHRWFAHYRRRFSTVELNAPFYRWPRDSTVLRWKRDAGRGKFRYAVKVNGAITHERRLRGTKRLIAKFYRIADLLGPQLGCFLFQFPPSFRYTAARLRSVLDQLDPAQPNVVEFRHRSWWKAAVYRRLAKRKIVFCSVSAPRLPEDLIAATSTAYVRFHGRKRWYRYDYSREELADWAAKIRRCPAATIWVYFNNDRDGCALRNARALKRALQAQTRRSP